MITEYIIYGEKPSTGDVIEDSFSTLEEANKELTFLKGRGFCGLIIEERHGRRIP